MLAVDATLSLGVPTIVGTRAQFDVALEFNATDGEQLSYFGLDVEPSSPQLVLPGSDYSAFTFVKSSPLLDLWTQIGFFNDPGFASSVEFDDSLIAPLPSGTYSLGTLEVDFGAAGLGTDEAFTVAVNGSGTIIGVEDPDDGFVFETVAFNPASRLVAPVSLSGETGVLEGSQYILAVNVPTNLGGTLLIDWGDGQENSYDVAELPENGELTHLYADGPLSATIQVELEILGGQRVPVGQLAVNIENVAPDSILTGSDRVDEGAIYSLVVGTVEDPGNDTVNQYVIDWGDGERQTILAGDLPANREVTHRYADGPASPTIRMELVDEDGIHLVGTVVPLTVDDVPPSVTLFGATSVNAGALYSLTIGPVDDPGTDGVERYVIDWGDGQQQVIEAEDLPDDRIVTHIFTSGPATPTIRVDVVDEDGSHAVVGTLSLAVSPVAPEIILTGPDTADIGSPYVLAISPVTGPGSELVDRYVIDWGDGMETVLHIDDLPPDGLVVHSYTQVLQTAVLVVELVGVDGRILAQFEKVLQVVDIDTEITLDEFENTASVPGETLVGEPVTITADLTDPDPTQQYIAWIEWGDDSEPEQVIATVDDESILITATHEYMTGGVYTVTFELVDDVGTVLTADTIAYITGSRVVDRILQLVGSDENDIITVTPQGEAEVFVNMTLPPAGNIRQTFQLAQIEQVEIYVGAGNDRVMVSDRLNLVTLIDGGPGHDQLQSGHGPSMIVGGPGDDMILGGDARDVLVGGDGTNQLLGYDGDNLLVGGLWEDTRRGRAEIFQLWLSASPLPQRLAAVSERLEIVADAAGDALFGGPGTVYFASGSDVISDGEMESISIPDAVQEGWAESHLQWQGIYTVIFAPADLLEASPESTVSSFTAESEGVAAIANLPTRNPYDVNGDGRVAPQDVVIVINRLNSGDLAVTPSAPFRIDVNGDGRLTPLDALAVINYLGSLAVVAEGESDRLGIPAPASNPPMAFPATSEQPHVEQPVAGPIRVRTARPSVPHSSPDESTDWGSHPNQRVLEPWDDLLQAIAADVATVVR